MSTTCSWKTSRSTVCAVSTSILDRAWRLHAHVALRPERFGALAYHFDTRRLSFLKNQELVALVQSLHEYESALHACRAKDIPENELPAYARALERLAATGMICERSAA